MEALAIGGSVIAVIQIADKIIGLCKAYLGAARDAPLDLRLILIETSTVKGILDNLEFLISCNHGPTALADLVGEGGPIEGCRKAMLEVENLLPANQTLQTMGATSKTQAVKTILRDLDWPLKQNKAKKCLQEIMQHKTTIIAALAADQAQDIREIKNRTADIAATLTELQRSQILGWLCTTDPSPLHNQEYRLYEPGTGDWMLRSEEWAAWLERKKRCIWIHGIPGSGKTVLLAHLAEHVRRHCDQNSLTVKMACVYYYCYFGNKQNEALPFLKWTLSQLCRQAGRVPACLYKLFQDGREPRLVELLAAIEEIAVDFSSIYILVDAIDESIPKGDVLDILPNLATNVKFQNIQILVTSRELASIERAMLAISTPISMRNPLLDEAIKIYIQSRLQNDEKLSKWPSDLQTEVLETLSFKAMGMFRWVFCQIETLKGVRCDSNEIKKTLANLPRTLNETYEKVFEQIPEEGRIFVQHALKWMNSHRELQNCNISSSILAQMTQESVSELEPDNNYAFDEEVLRELCGCLILVGPDRSSSYSNESYSYTSVAFSHHTVWEFLGSSRIRNGSAACFAFDRAHDNLNFAQRMIRGALDREPNQDLRNGPVEKERGLEIIDNDLNTYYLISSIMSLHKWGRQICQQGQMTDAALSLLDVSKPHVSYLNQVARNVQGSTHYFSGCCDFFPESHFWDMRLLEGPPNRAIETLVNLLLVDESCELAKVFAKEGNMEDLGNDALDLKIEFAGEDRFGFRISIGEIIALLSMEPSRPLRLFLESREKYSLAQGQSC